MYIFNSQYLQWNNWNAHVHACAVINNDYRHMNWNILIENITPNYQTWAEYFFKFYSFWMCVHEKDVVFPKLIIGFNENQSTILQLN